MLFSDLPEIAGVVENPTSEDYAAAARYALKRKALPRAVEQISAALALAPLDAAHLRLLDDILATSFSPLQLVKLREGPVFFGLLAVRAYALAREGQIDDALAALGEAAAFDPTTPWLEWTRRWVADEKAARRVDAATCAALVVRLLEAAHAKGATDEGLRRNLAAAATLAARVATAHPTSAPLAATRCRLLFELGGERDALAALAGHEGTWEAEIARAGVHREQGRLAEAAACYERAAALREGEASALVDLGDVRLELGDPERAVVAYDAALSIAPSPGVSGARHYARWLASGDPEDAGALDDLARGEPALGALAKDVHAYDDALIAPEDPLVPVVRDALVRATKSDPQQTMRVRARADRALSPSAWVAFSLGMQRLGRTGTLAVDRTGAPAGGAWIATDDGGFRPALDAPPAAVHERVRAIARAPFSWVDWKATARATAGEIDPLVAAATHPAPVPDHIHPIEWVHAWQLAAALLVAAANLPWPARLRALEGFLAAEGDWLPAAGVLGLCAAAEWDAQLRDEVVGRLLLLEARERTSPTAAAHAIAVAGTRLATAPERATFLGRRARRARRGAG